MQTLNEIRAMLAGRGIGPKHRLGQNFLHDHNVLRKLIDAADVQPGEVVLEVGPGTGALTEALLEGGAEVIAVDIDSDMIAITGDRINHAGLTLLHTDALDRGRTLHPMILAALAERPFKLVANLPYQIASPLMATLALHHADQCRGQFVTIQKEVADRLRAGEGSKQYGPLGIIVQTFATVELIATVSPGSFWPSPKVVSAIVAVRPRSTDPLTPAREEYARFITQVFTKRRKQLRNILGEDLPPHIPASARPEQLTTAEFVELFTHLQRV